VSFSQLPGVVRCVRSGVGFVLIYELTPKGQAAERRPREAASLRKTVKGEKGYFSCRRDDEILQHHEVHDDFFSARFSFSPSRLFGRRHCGHLGFIGVGAASLRALPDQHRGLPMFVLRDLRAGSSDQYDHEHHDLLKSARWMGRYVGTSFGCSWFHDRSRTAKYIQKKWLKILFIILALYVASVTSAGILRPDVGTDVIVMYVGSETRSPGPITKARAFYASIGMSPHAMWYYVDPYVFSSLWPGRRSVLDAIGTFLLALSWWSSGSFTISLVFRATQAPRQLNQHPQDYRTMSQSLRRGDEESYRALNSSQRCLRHRLLQQVRFVAGRCGRFFRPGLDAAAFCGDRDCRPFYAFGAITWSFSVLLHPGAHRVRPAQRHLPYFKGQYAMCDL